MVIFKKIERLDVIYFPTETLYYLRDFFILIVVKIKFYIDPFLIYSCVEKYVSTKGFFDNFGMNVLPGEGSDIG